MFIKTYNSTIKNLFRSVTFWLSVVVVMVLVVRIVSIAGFGYVDMNTHEMIWDTDPRFELRHHTYLKLMGNTPEKLMNYIIPIFSVIITVLCLNRDYGDGFFEIEKCGGIKAHTYLLGRLSALITVGFAVTAIASFILIHTYVFTRGGIVDASLGDYLAESTLSMIRNLLFKALPGIIFFIGLTYFLGAVFKNGAIAAVGGFGYAIGAYVYAMFNVAKVGFFIEYLAPCPRKVSDYFYYYGTDDFEETIRIFETSWVYVIICVALLVGIAAVLSVGSLFLISKRTK